MSAAKKRLGDRYEVGEMIGSGGMADVYRGIDTRLNREVAIKILRSDLARDPAFISRFKKEALAAAGLSFSGIVAVYDSGEDSGSSYIVMELVNGRTLRDLLKSDEQISIHRALDITSGILEALEYSHRKGIIHRDIKPGNVMITDSGVIKVMDFGIARALSDVGATMTSTWNIVGTAQYLSPEQATGEIADRRSDIYSVGCVLYELLVGEPPFTGDTPVSIAYQHVSGHLVPASEYVDNLDKDIDTIISVALSKDPAHRYQDAGAMLEDVRRASKGDPVTTKIRRINKKKSLIIGVVALLAVAGVGASFMNFSSKSSTVGYELPNVVGLSEASARGLLPGFTVTIQHAPDARIPKDRVASQLPLASSKVQKGSSVTLTISDGPGDTIVPVDLVGKTLEQARISLAAAGLTISKTQPVDSNQDPGVILSSDPVPGTTVTAGSGVVLQIASGQVQVPALIGLTEIEAQTVLTQGGFLPRVIYAYQSSKDIDTVLAQAPDAGTSANIGSVITITVNKNA
jgi:serine/threonine-protein kinase